MAETLFDTSAKFVEACEILKRILGRLPTIDEVCGFEIGRNYNG